MKIGFVADIARFYFAGARGSPVSDTWDNDIAYMVYDKWELKLYSVKLKGMVQVLYYYYNLFSFMNYNFICFVLIAKECARRRQRDYAANICRPPEILLGVRGKEYFRETAIIT